jgi:hypothetical protein
MPPATQDDDLDTLRNAGASGDRAGRGADAVIAMTDRAHPGGFELPLVAGKRSERSLGELAERYLDRLARPIGHDRDGDQAIGRADERRGATVSRPPARRQPEREAAAAVDVHLPGIAELRDRVRRLRGRGRRLRSAIGPAADGGKRQRNQQRQCRAQGHSGD